MTTEHIQIDDVTPRIAYVATSGQTAFNVPFVFFDDADLVVYQNDVALTLDTDYTVTGELSNDDAARVVTLETGATVSDSIVIVRDIAVARTTDFPDSGPLQINSLNTQIDKIFALLQQLEDSIARTLRLADSDTLESFDIPAVADRASKFLAFDADGEPTVAAAVTEVPVSAFMQTVLDDTTGAAARSTLGISDVSSAVGAFQYLNFR